MNSSMNLNKNSFEKLVDIARARDIKVTVSDLIKRIKQLHNFYTFSFKISLKDIAQPDVFWKILKIKSKKAELFAPNIVECRVTETAPQGFIREIIMKGAHGLEHARERVIIDDVHKNVLFFIIQTDGKNKLIGINSVESKEEESFFVGTYVLDIENNAENTEIMSQIDKAFSRNIEINIQNIKNFIDKDLVNKTYKELFFETHD